MSQRSLRKPRPGCGWQVEGEGVNNMFFPIGEYEFWVGFGRKPTRFLLLVPGVEEQRMRRVG